MYRRRSSSPSFSQQRLDCFVVSPTTSSFTSLTSSLVLVLVVVVVLTVSFPIESCPFERLRVTFLSRLFAPSGRSISRTRPRKRSRKVRKVL